MNAKQDEMKDELVGQAEKLFEKLPMVGPIVWLQLQVPSLRHTFINDIEWRVLPTVSLGQCKLYMKGKAPLAYVSWAMVNDEVEQRFLAGHMKLAPSEWSSGDNIWLIDVVSPFGGVKEIVADLKENVFKGKDVKYLTPDESGEGLTVKLLNG